MILIFFDVEKLEKFTFYGDFSYFLVNIDFIHMDSELQYGWLDSSNISQNNHRYPWDHAFLFGFWKIYDLGDLMAIFLTF